MRVTFQLAVERGWEVECLSALGTLDFFAEYRAVLELQCPIEPDFLPARATCDFSAEHCPTIDGSPGGNDLILTGGPEKALDESTRFNRSFGSNMATGSSEGGAEKRCLWRSGQSCF